MESKRSFIIYTSICLGYMTFLSCSENVITTHVDDHAIYEKDTLWMKPTVEHHQSQPHAIPVMFYIEEGALPSDSASRQ